ncbi:ATP-binding protein [Xylanibacter brevis]|uniref:ATP-binding protein n=1 Tax=Xylanibacter brevis TaxID=83231 RepID=UPI000481413D|nr:ATP-binding protein [Xylanibacter brevis]
MKHIIIHSVGPIVDADIDLRQISVIIGPQSLGKSTILKVASYCSWVEKKIELQQDPSLFDGEKFILPLMTFHKMGNYLNDDSSILYESDYMKFSYTHSKKLFSFEWKEARWNYKRTKISYIPSERNLVAVIPNWFEISLEHNNIRSFMTEWETARRSTTMLLDVLHLNVSYRYDPDLKKDMVKIQDGSTMDITDISSGLQSLIPLYVHLNYLNSTLAHSDSPSKIAGDWVNEGLRNSIYEELFVKKGRTEVAEYSTNQDIQTDEVPVPMLYGKYYGEDRYVFSHASDVDDFEEVLNQYVLTDHCDIFLEEPENNLFPPTQAGLTNWILDLANGEHANSFFIATHSPYVLGELLKNKTPMGLFFIYEKDGATIVKTASDEDMQNIYDYGVDAFFNIENLAE